MESSDTGKFDPKDRTTTLQLVSGYSVAFYEVTDGTSTDTLSGKTTKLMTVADGTAAGTVTVGSSSGFSMELTTLATLDDKLTDPGIYISRDQDKAPILNFAGLEATDTITGALTVTREADYNSTFGWYKVANIEGAVTGSDGQLIFPGQAGYAAAALTNKVTGVLSELDGITVADNGSSNIDLAFSSTDILAPYAIVNGSLNYFGYAAANPDKINHFRMLGNNILGFEDMNGGGDLDFDDNTMAFNNFKLNAVVAG